MSACRNNLAVLTDGRREMICLGCKHSYMDYYGIECRISHTPFWNEDEECEDCDGYHMRREQDEDTLAVDEAKAKLKGEIE